MCPQAGGCITRMSVCMCHMVAPALSCHKLSQIEHQSYSSAQAALQPKRTGIHTMHLLTCPKTRASHSSSQLGSPPAHLSRGSSLALCLPPN